MILYCYHFFYCFTELSEKIDLQKSSEINDAKNEEYLKNNLELKDKILNLQNEKNFRR